LNSLPRCFIPATEWVEGAAVAIPPDETHHLIRVLRVQPGECVMVFDGCGREAEALVESSGRLGLSVRLRQSLTHSHPPARVILFQAVLKGERMDEVVQKAVELGAAELAPLQAEHSVVKLTAANRAHKLERWRSIALGAARQSGNPFLMEIREPVSAAASAAEAGALDLALFGSLEPGARPLWERVGDVRHRRGVRVGLWIGPEGDWSEAEYAALRKAGLGPVTLGPLVLRSETAAFYGLSVIGAGFTAGSAIPAG
jgi:16S rRNA (uracil1498-N3)-methyltransferase